MTKSLEELREKLWQLIFDDPYASVRVAEEACALADEIYRAGEEAGRNAAIEDLFSIEREKWSDAVHCTCMGYALVQLSGGEDSKSGQEMEERLVEAARTNKQEV